MKTITVTLLLGLVFNISAFSKPVAAAGTDSTLAVNEIRYDARLADDEARFAMKFEVEAKVDGESSAKKTLPTAPARR